MQQRPPMTPDATADDAGHRCRCDRGGGDDDDYADGRAWRRADVVGGGRDAADDARADADVAADAGADSSGVAGDAGDVVVAAVAAASLSMRPHDDGDVHWHDGANADGANDGGDDARTVMTT